MPRLFSYTIPVDDGAAPNPYGGICTLAICKPAIRRVAHKGDWVVGLGSKRAPSGDLSGRVVYAMKVSNVITFAEYDELAQRELPIKIPDFEANQVWSKLGDCIYDYSNGAIPIKRRGVHDKSNESTDLNGINVLISDEFYYFGKNTIPLPNNLTNIVHQRSGHKSNANNPYVGAFVNWINSSGFEPNRLHGEPDRKLNWDQTKNCVIC